MRCAGVNTRELTRVQLVPLRQIGGALATSVASGLPPAAAGLIHQRNSLRQLGCSSVTILARSILATNEGCGILIPDRLNTPRYSAPRVATQGDSVIRRLAQSVAKPNSQALLRQPERDKQGCGRAENKITGIFHGKRWLPLLAQHTRLTLLN